MKKKPKPTELDVAILVRCTKQTKKLFSMMKATVDVTSGELLRMMLNTVYDPKTGDYIAGRFDEIQRLVAAGETSRLHRIINSNGMVGFIRDRPKVGDDMSKVKQWINNASVVLEAVVDELKSRDEPSTCEWKDVQPKG